MEHGLRAIIAERQESLIDFTKALVEIPTDNPPGVAYHASVDLIAHQLSDLSSRMKSSENHCHSGETRFLFDRPRSKTV